jgi:hypothetical protein
MIRTLLAPIMITWVLLPLPGALEPNRPVRTGLSGSRSSVDSPGGPLQVAGATKKKWDSLAKRVFAGMTTDEMMVILPPRRPDPTATKLVEPIVTLWNGQTFHLHYSLDDDFYVEVGGSGKRSSLVLSSRPRIYRRVAVVRSP